jgi:hypothetical protein
VLERGDPLHCSEPDHLGRSEQFVADAHHDRDGEPVAGADTHADTVIERRRRTGLGES